jgi:hypothetical protein
LAGVLEDCHLHALRVPQRRGPGDVEQRVNAPSKAPFEDELRCRSRSLEDTAPDVHPLVDLELEVNTARCPGLSRGGRPSAQCIPRGDSVPQEALRPNLHLGEVRRGAGETKETRINQKTVYMGFRGSF